MTTEEAIRQLNDLNSKLCDLHYGDIALFNEDSEYGYDFYSALSLAIEALEEQMLMKEINIKVDKITKHISKFDFEEIEDNDE